MGKTLLRPLKPIRSEHHNLFNRFAKLNFITYIL